MLMKLDRFEQDYPLVKTEGIPYGKDRKLTTDKYEKKMIELIIPDIPLSAGQKEVLESFMKDGNNKIIIRIARG